MTIKLLTEHHLEFLSLKGGCTGLPESTLVKMPHCWKSHVTAHMSHSSHVLTAVLHMGCNATKPVLGISVKGRFKLAYSAPETS